MKSPKNRLGRVVGVLLDQLRKLYMNGTVIQKFSAFLKVQKILGNFCLSEQILQRKQSLGAPNKYKLAVPTPHTEFYKRSLSHNGNLLWNSLTLEVRQLTSLYVFKGKLKNLNLKIRNIFTQPLCKACFLLLLLQYLNEIPCINNVTLPLSA